MAIAMSTEESNIDSSLDLVSSASSGELELSYESSSFDLGVKELRGFIHSCMSQLLATVKMKEVILV